MDQYESIADALNKAAIAKGWNGRVLAENLGVAKTTAYRWLQGSSEPDVDLWPKIEEVLGFEEGMLFEIRQRAALQNYEASKRSQVDPNKIAAHGNLKDEDRPAMAQLLEQILENQAELREQQAKIIEHLNLDEDEP